MNDCQKISEILHKIKSIENLINKLWFLYYRKKYQKTDLINELNILYDIFTALQKDSDIEELIKNSEKILKKRRKKNSNDIFLIKSLKYYNNNGLSYEKYLELIELRINFFDKLLKETIATDNITNYFTQTIKIQYKSSNIYSDFLRNYGVKKDIMQRIRNNTQNFLQKNYKKLSENLQKNYKKLPLKKDSEILNQKTLIKFLCDKNDLYELDRHFCLQKINFSFQYDENNLCNTIIFFSHNVGILLTKKTLNKVNLRTEKTTLLKNIYAFLFQFHLCRSEEFAEYIINFWQEELKISKKTFNVKNLHRTMNAFCNDNDQIIFDELSFLNEISQNTQIEYKLMHKKSLDDILKRKEIQSKKIVDSSAWLNGNFFQNHLTVYALICAHKIMEHFKKDEKRQILVGISNGDFAPVSEFIEKNIHNDELCNVEKEDCEEYLEYLKKKS